MGLNSPFSPYKLLGSPFWRQATFQSFLGVNHRANLKETQQLQILLHFQRRETHTNPILPSQPSYIHDDSL